MKKIDKLTAETNMDNRLAVEDIAKPGRSKGSTASHCKRADYAVRDYLMAHGVGSVEDVRCRPGSKHDWELYIRRTHIIGETKVGEGALAYANTAEELAIDESFIYPDVDYIAYCAEPKKLKAHPENKAKLFRVFTRVQFIEMLTDTGKGGLTGSLRIHQQTTGTWQLELKAFVTTQCAARLGKYEDYCKAHGVPTLEEFRRVLRG